MFSSGPNYTKLKTHLRLSVNRLKLLEKKKTELAQKSRKEIADYLAAGKVERAKIRVEHIIREDYLVEAMEIVEMYCDLLLARFGLLTQMKELDSGIAEQVSSLIWVAPRLQADVAELKVISELLTSKYGKPFAENCRTASGEHYVSEKLMHKLAVQAPPKLLVEKYLIEIAKIYNIDYEPDAQIMKEAEPPAAGMLIDLSAGNNLGGSSGGGGGGGGFAAPQPAGFIGYPQAPQLPPMPMPPMNSAPFSYPAPGCGAAAAPFGAGSVGSPSAPPALNYNILPNAGESSSLGANGGGGGGCGGNEKKDLNINTSFLREETNAAPPPAYTATVSPDDNLHPRIVRQPSAPPPSYSAAVNAAQQQNLNKPKPQPRSKMPTSSSDADDGFPNLPSVPSDLPDFPDVPSHSGPGSAAGSVRPGNDDEIDFDDLARRFEELTKKK